MCCLACALGLLWVPCGTEALEGHTNHNNYVSDLVLKQPGHGQKADGRCEYTHTMMEAFAWSPLLKASDSAFQPGAVYIYRAWYLQ